MNGLVFCIFLWLFPVHCHACSSIYYVSVYVIRLTRQRILPFGFVERRDPVNINIISVRGTNQSWLNGTEWINTEEEKLQVALFYGFQIFKSVLLYRFNYIKAFGHIYICIMVIQFIYMQKYLLFTCRLLF